VKPLCETIVLEFLPVIRAIIAKSLIEKYGMSQKQAAEKLGISQPAISQYKKEIRGYRADIVKHNSEAMRIIDGLAKKVAYGELTQKEASMEFCELCRYIRPEGSDCTIPEIYANSK